jgi:hypothetical protein
LFLLLAYLLARPACGGGIPAAVEHRFTPSLSGALGPASSAKILQSRILRSLALLQETPHRHIVEQERRFLRRDMLTDFAWDVFLDEWEVGSADGTTFGAHPSVTYVRKASDVSLTVPVHVTTPDDGDDDLFAIGLDAAGRYRFDRPMAVGAHGMYLHETGGDSDDMNFWGAGAFVSAVWKATAELKVTFCLAYEAIEPEDGDTVQQLVPGVNLGMQLGESGAINAFLLSHNHFDDDQSQDDYRDVGVDVSWIMETWALNAGVRASLDPDDYDSVDFHVGTSRRF